jgi:hypothetical protein
MMNPGPRTPDAATSQALLTCIQRLEELLEQENAALREHRDADLPECNRRKSRALLELTRISRAIPSSAIEPGARAGIARLRENLIRNRDLLQIHINAVRQVSDLLARVIAENESDGTYSAQRHGARPQ